MHGADPAARLNSRPPREWRTRALALLSCSARRLRACHLVTTSVATKRIHRHRACARPLAARPCPHQIPQWPSDAARRPPLTTHIGASLLLAPPSKTQGQRRAPPPGASSAFAAVCPGGAGPQRSALFSARDLAQACGRSVPASLPCAARARPGGPPRALRGSAAGGGWGGAYPPLRGGLLSTSAHSAGTAAPGERCGSRWLEAPGAVLPRAVPGGQGEQRGLWRRCGPSSPALGALRETWRGRGGATLGGVALRQCKHVRWRRWRTRHLGRGEQGTAGCRARVLLSVRAARRAAVAACHVQRPGAGLALAGRALLSWLAALASRGSPLSRWRDRGGGA